MNEVTPVNIALRPQNYKELRRLSDLIYKSAICPKGVKDPDELFLRMHFGLDVGLSPLQAATNVAIINGKASLYGDAMLAVVQASPKYEYHKIEELSSSDKEDWGYRCTVKRKGMDPVSVSFTKKDAMKAGLWGKQGPWVLYPQRMLKFKAIGFALRDVFADVLQGLISYEEAIDHPSDNKEIIIEQETKDSIPYQPQETVDFVSKNIDDANKEEQVVFADIDIEDVR